MEIDQKSSDLGKLVGKANGEGRVGGPWGGGREILEIIKSGGGGIF